MSGVGSLDIAGDRAYGYEVALLNRTAAEAGVPVLDTWYPVVNYVGEGVLHEVSAFREDDDAIAKELQCRILLDAFTDYTDVDRSCNDSTQYYFFIEHRVNNQDVYFNTSTAKVSVTKGIGGHYFFRQSCVVQIRCTTTALGANPELKAMVFWGKKL